MSSPSTSASSAARLENITEINKRANEKIKRSALDCRTKLVPTHYARKRATRLCLSVDIDKARNLHHTAVSAIPPPVLENTPPPSYSYTQFYLSSLSHLTRVQDQEENALPSHKVVGREREIKRMTRKALAQDVPEDVSSSRSSGSTASWATQASSSYSLTREVYHYNSSDTEQSTGSGSKRRAWSPDSSASDQSSGSEGPAPRPRYTIRIPVNKRKLVQPEDEEYQEKRAKYTRKSWVNTPYNRAISKLPSSCRN
ncbi:hypothetical protein CPC08DRAFT_250183 [Agrocybe pediades]|nr:hypothetical protein CPC08DRAFT_250183 [Agrocybe pediades]